MNRRMGLRTALMMFACLGVAPSAAEAGDVLKPYVLLQLDTSSSMQTATGFGPPSCPGSTDTRLAHAKCAINNIANAYGDMVLGLARFRQSTTDVNPADGCTMSAGCPATTDLAFQPLVGIVDGNNGDLARWTDFTAGTCSSFNPADDPEIFFGSGTPIGGALAGAQRYWQGLQGSDGTVLWPAGSPGFDPIRNDPLRTVFLPTGRQCRPYIVISLTDGNESCSGNPVGAAGSLLATVVDGRTYRIETKAIGFDVGAPDQQIEDIAHAGGAPDVPGVNEGQYVQNEEQLQLAISQILADALRFEQCNNLDDDCDMLVDEDFPNKGQVCFDNGIGACRGQGVYVCNAIGSNTECQITMPGAMPSPEVCNNLDDNCNGQVDEGLICNCTGVETCNNLDDDCDTRVDENLSRDCGTDVGECVRGTESCVAGMWQGCTAVTGNAEVCDTRDNDCDGVADDLTRSCSNLPGGNPGVGPCHGGTQVCPPGTGMWGLCLGEVAPTAEACDTVDNDCDGTVDEGTGGADCSGACGVGHTVCMNGVITCQTMTTGGPEVCNNFDDNCNGQIDENIPDMGPCNAAPDGTPLCMPGVLRCMNGAFVCVGGTPATPEVCDCRDNDCDTRTDEEPPALCPGGSTCTHCQCAMPCASGEFPCPAGRTCVDNFCLIDTCFGVTCDPLPNGDRTECRDGTCVRACDGVTCPAGQVCFGPAGGCRPDDCSTFPERCTAGQQCVDGACVADPCAGVTCPGDQYCTGGSCVGSCGSVDCPTGQRCRLGMCEADPCGHPCGFGHVCNETTHECQPDPCPGVMCPVGEACNPQDGHCVRDACQGVTCPGADEVCRGGTCDLPPTPPDAGVGPDSGSYVTTGGGGGCQTGGDTGAGALLLSLGVAFAVRRRRRGGDA